MPNQRRFKPRRSGAGTVTRGVELSKKGWVAPVKRSEVELECFSVVPFPMELVKMVADYVQRYGAIIVMSSRAGGEYLDLSDDANTWTQLDDLVLPCHNSDRPTPWMFRQNDRLLLLVHPDADPLWFSMHDRSALQFSNRKIRADTSFYLGDESRLYGYGACLLSRNRLVVFGGHHDGYESRIRQDIRQFDPTSNKWATIGTLPTDLCYPAVTQWNDVIYVLGGCSETLWSPVHECFTLHITDDVRGVLIDQLPAFHDCLPARHAATTVRNTIVVAGKNYKAGGKAPSTSYLPLVQTTDNAAWQTLHGCETPVGECHSLLAVENRYVVFVGADVDGKESGVCILDWSLPMDARKWRPLNSMNSERYFMAALAYQ